jgi:2-aminoadipate transaminase
MSLERRKQLVELADKYGVPIVEDDPYGQLRYEGRHLPPLVKVDADYHACAYGERSFRGSVLYLGTFSKTLAPGFRLGWVVAPEEVIVRLVQAKQAADLHTSSFCQHVVFEAARGGFLDRHVRVIRHVYGARRDGMLRALAAHFPPTARWTRPQGGLFLWVTLPAGIDSEELLQDALDERVAFVPGRSFHPHGEGAGTFRLNYSYSAPSRIDEGIRRLGRVLRRRL